MTFRDDTRDDALVTANKQSQKDFALRRRFLRAAEDVGTRRARAASPAFASALRPGGHALASAAEAALRRYQETLLAEAAVVSLAQALDDALDEDEATNRDERDERTNATTREKRDERDDSIQLQRVRARARGARLAARPAIGFLRRAVRGGGRSGPFVDGKAAGPTERRARPGGRAPGDEPMAHHRTSNAPSRSPRSLMAALLAHGVPCVRARARTCRQRLGQRVLLRSVRAVARRHQPAARCDRPPRLA